MNPIKQEDTSSRFEENSIRVLHVYKTYFPDTQGGLEETVRQICSCTKSERISHRIFTLSANPDPQIIRFPEADVYRYPLTFEVSSCGMSASGILGFRKMLQWADIVHYHYPWPYGDLLHFICSVKKPSLVSYQSDIVRQKNLSKLYRPLQNRFLGSVDRIIASSPNYMESSQVLSRYKEKVSVIPNGLAEIGYLPIEKDKLEVVRKEYGNDFFLFVGVLRYYKGLQYLLAAAKDQSFNVIIAGQGPMEQELKSQAETLGLVNVRFIGYVDDASKNCLMQLAKAVVFPSHERSEAFGMTLLEGAMFSRPLITAEIGTGTTYINQHNKTGLVVPPKDVDALRVAMLRFAADEEFTVSCGLQARARYEQLFTGNLMGEKYVELYHEIVQEHQG